jgi:hypothetical protein
MANLLDSCIKQHGEGARAYIDTAIALGEMCLLPNFGFDPSVQDVIDDLLKGQDPSYSGIRDVKIFAKASICVEFDKDVIELHNIVEMFNVGKQFYPEEIAEMEVYDQLGDYWSASEIYRSAKEFDVSAFGAWMYEIFLRDPEDLDRRAKVGKLIEIVNPKLFSKSKQNISMYCMTEDNNENTSFAPYFFVGDRCLVIIAKRWIL